jgi:two-component system chemotaxis sensor kinase CheA
MAGTMGYKRMQRLTHDMENVFSEIRTGKMKVKAELVDVLFKGLDALESYLDGIVNTSDEGTEDNEEIINALNRILKEGLGQATKAEAPKAEAKVEAAPVAAAAVTQEKVNVENLVLADHEVRAVEKMREEGGNAFNVTVYVQESCILKAARAFLVFKSLEDLGDIIKSSPEVQDIEDERFDFDFSLVFVTKESMEKVKNCILNVSEIKSVAIAEVELPEKKDQDVTEGTKSEKKATSEVAKEAPAKAAAQAAKQKETAKPVVNRSVRVDIEKLDDLMNLVSELIIAKNGLVSMNNVETKVESGQGFHEQIEYLERITTNLHQSVMKVRMVPIESVVNRFPRMIRDLSKNLDKKMELYMTGEDTELDRTVIDEIGLEKNEERVRLGKPEAGSIFLDAYQEGNNVVIEVRDDGAGIDVVKIKRKAIERGTITLEQAESMSDKDIIDLLFRPSFSTAEKISDVSGRGVGLDVVKTKIEALGGNIETKTVLGEGSKFIIRLPLTLAIIQALMVELGHEKYAIPLGSIETIESVAINEIKYVQSKEVIHLRGNVIPLIRLRSVLDVEDPIENVNELTVVIVKKGDKLAGLVVDNLIGQLEIVIKSIGKYINNSKMISGATILGDGEIALILDVNSLV